MLKVLSLPTSSHINTMFRPEAWAALRREFDVIENDGESQRTAAQVIESLSGCDAVLTGWGTHAFSRATFDAAPTLRLIAHTAGTVKGTIPDALVAEVLIPRGITIYSGNDGLAVNVAEAAVGMMIMLTRRWPQHRDVFRATRDRESRVRRDGPFLLGATVGIVSASKAARHTMRMLQPFDCEILLYDPYLSPAQARGLGARLVELNELFAASSIVSVHSPALPATRNLIGRRQLKLMRDGAAFINTARGMVVDHDALLEECRDGRIDAALDVTMPEPLPADSEFWNLPNVVLLPHVAGFGDAGCHRIGDGTLAALRSIRDGRPVGDAVPLDRWDQLA